MEWEAFIAKLKADLPALVTPFVNEAVDSRLKGAEVINKLLQSTNPQEVVLAEAMGRAMVYQTAGALKYTPEEKEATYKFLCALQNKTNVNETTNSEGAYLVPTAMSTNFQRLKQLVGVVRKYATVYSMTTKTLTVPKTGTASVLVYRPGEAGSITETSALGLFGQTSLTAVDVAGVVAITNNFLRDSGINAVDILTVMFAEALAKDEDSTALTAIAAAGTAVRFATTAASSVALGDLIDMVAGVDDGAVNCRWTFSRWFFCQLMKMVDSNSRSIFPIMNGALPNNILGYPYDFSSAMAKTSAADTCFAIFGDYGAGLAIGDTLKASVDLATQATLAAAGNLWQQNMTAIRVTECKDIEVQFATCFTCGLTKAI